MRGAINPSSHARHPPRLLAIRPASNEAPIPSNAKISHRGPGNPARAAGCSSAATPIPTRTPTKNMSKIHRTMSCALGSDDRRSPISGCRAGVPFVAQRRDVPLESDECATNRTRVSITALSAMCLVVRPGWTVDDGRWRDDRGRTEDGQRTIERERGETTWSH